MDLARPRSDGETEGGMAARLRARALEGLPLASVTRESCYRPLRLKEPPGQARKRKEGDKGP